MQNIHCMQNSNCAILHFISGGDLAPSLGGRKNVKIFADQDFLMRFSGKKFPFSRRKFLMTFFSHRPGFSDFTFLYCIKCPIGLRPILHKKTTISEQNSLIRPFFTLFVLLRASDNNTSLNIWRTNAWAVPHLKFW